MNDFEIKGSSCLVVGGAGFVGSNLVLMLLQEGAETVFVVDNLLSSISANIPRDSRVKFILGSIADQRVLNQLPGKLDFVWHLACYHGNQSSIHDPIADHDNNTFTSLMLFDHLSKQANVRKVVYAAAGCAVAEKTFSDSKATPENAPISLFHDSPYSISKIIGEMYGNFYFTSAGLPFVRARFQNVYGPREILGAGRWRGTPASVWRNVIPTFIWKSLRNDPIHLDNGGLTTRDFVYVTDLCRGLIICALSGLPGEAYNLASGKETSISDLAHLILDKSQSSSTIVLSEKRSWDSSGMRFGDPTKARDSLGFQCVVDLDEGIQKTIEWVKQNYDLVQKTISNHDYFLEEK